MATKTSKDEKGAGKKTWKDLLPPDVYELRTTGILPFRSEGMKCADCGLPVALFLNYEPEIDPSGEIKPGTLRGLVWGEDVSVVCMCCSYAGCPHRVKTEVA